MAYAVALPPTVVNRLELDLMDIHAALGAALQAVVDVNGTDLALSIGSAPLVPLDGAFLPRPGLPAVDHAVMAEFLRDLLDEEHLAQLWVDRDIDFAFSFGDDRFRGNVLFPRGLHTVAP